MVGVSNHEPLTRFSQNLSEFVRRLPVWVTAFITHELLMLCAYFVPYPTFPGVQHRAFAGLGHFWFQWDALWYISIGQHGYQHLPGVPALAGTAFFPWLPLMIRVVGVYPSFGLTQLAFATTLWLLVRLCRNLGLSTGQIAAAVFLLALNPAAIYFSTLYAEPWTVFFILSSIDFGRRQRWGYASVFGLLAATTQATGVLVGIFPLTEFLWSLSRRRWHMARGPFVWGLGPFLGIASFAAYLGGRFHNPLLFASIQSTPYWSASWRWPWLQWYAALRLALTHKPVDVLLLGLWAVVSLFLVSIPFLFRSMQFSLDPFRIGLIVYGLVGIILSLSFYHAHSPLYSTVRIVSIYFPLYIGISRGPRWFGTTSLILFTSLAFYGALLFTHQWWYQ